MSLLLEVRDLHVNFRGPTGTSAAVNGADLTIHAHEIVALVGESGSGKTMTALSLGRLLPPSAQWRADALRFKAQDLLTAPDEAVRRLLGTEIAYVFQDPAASLNPVMTVGEQLCEPWVVHQRIPRVAATAHAVKLLAAVQLSDPVALLAKYPHQLSGGQQQRVMLAMALALEPSLLIADEPTTALDATIQAQILDLLITLHRQRGLSVLLITHDLLQVAPIAHRICVMQQGRIVEVAPRDELYRAPKHPYTQALLNAVPQPGRGRLEVA